MTALAAIKQEENMVFMQTEAQLTFNGGRIVQIDVIPTGESMEEVDHCECISHDFLSHLRPADFCIEDGRMVVCCDSGVFSFGIRYKDDRLKKMEGKFCRSKFVFQKRGYGFSFIS